MEKLYFVILIEVIAIIIIEVIVYRIIKLQFSYKIERRISEYSITPQEKYDLPWLDKQKNNLFKAIKFISKIFIKSEVLKKYSNRYNKYIEYHEKSKIKPIDYVSIKFVVGLFLIILYFISSFIRSNVNFMFGLLIFLLGFFIPDLYLMIVKKQRIRELEENLLEAVIIMNNAFKSGKNILEAIEIVKNELNGPLADEFKKVYLDLTYGLDIDVVFNRFYERVKLDDIKYISSSLTLLNQTGGNVVKVFSSIENNFYDKKVLNEELEALTSSSKLMYKMLMFIPVIIVLVLYMLNPEYFNPLFQSKLGIIIILLSLVLYIGYALVIKKVTKVKL